MLTQQQTASTELQTADLGQAHTECCWVAHASWCLSNSALDSDKHRNTIPNTNAKLILELNKGDDEHLK